MKLIKPEISLDLVLEPIIKSTHCISQVRDPGGPGEEQLVRPLCAGSGPDQRPGRHPQPALHHRESPAEQARQGQHAHQRQGGHGLNLQDP